VLGCRCERGGCGLTPAAASPTGVYAQVHRALEALAFNHTLRGGEDSIVAHVVKLAQAETFAPPALTITRLDLVGMDPGNATAALAAAWPHVSRHPGNDCFVVRRDRVPSEVLLLGHPVGFRPWGAWLQEAFAQNSRFRRIAGSKGFRWTFHVGKGLWVRGREEGAGARQG
jgi:hypothetical protein